MNQATIIGIDPGLANTGWGVIQAQGSQLHPLAYGCISTSNDRQLPQRLESIHTELLEYIQRYQPSVLCVEGVYFGANTKSALATAQARGAALVACAKAGLEYAEYTPMQIKQAVVGTGSADKAQVQFMVRTILDLDHDPKPDHAADALAAAICHAHSRNTLQGKVSIPQPADEAEARRRLEERAAQQ